MKIVFHGAAQEVGKSCIEIISNKKNNYLLDCGVKFCGKRNEYPKNLDNINEIDAVFLSHAHMDHSGALPLIEHKNLNCPIYCTDVTWKTTFILLNDGYHLEKLKNTHPLYNEIDVREVGKDVKIITYDKKYLTKNREVEFTYLNAGHIPGSAHILLNLENKNLLYTADTNTEETNLMIPSDIENIKNIDILITETTYGNREHPKRFESEEGFLKKVKEGIKKNATILIPVFGVGRSQEILLILSRLNEDCEIYLDGLPRKLTKKYIESQDKYINNKDLLNKMFNRVKLVEKPQDREFIARKKGCIILTTSGMMQGGPIMSYAPKLLFNPNTYLIMTGYQARGTNGRRILDDGIFYDKTEHKEKKIKCQVFQFDFSAHFGRERIINMIKKMQPKTLILQHGDMDALESVENEIKRDCPNIKVIVAKLNEEIEIN